MENEIPLNINFDSLSTLVWEIVNSSEAVRVRGNLIGSGLKSLLDISVYFVYLIIKPLLSKPSFFTFFFVVAKESPCVGCTAFNFRSSFVRIHNASAINSNELTSYTLIILTAIFSPLQGICIDSIFCYTHNFVGKMYFFLK